jgi:hypothetical protein
MYVMSRQPVMVRRRRRTLGATTPGGAGGSWDPTFADKLSQGISDWWKNTPVESTYAPGFLDQPDPNSSFTDYLLNAATGKATNAQITYAASDCVRQIQNMRRLAAANPGSVVAPPVGAEAGCLQTAKAASGGSADDLLANLTTPSTITNWAWIAALGVLGAIVLLR